MNFTKIDIYTTSEAMDGLTGLLEQHGVTGFILSDGADFQAFLDNKDYSWDYVDDTLMALRNAKPCITFYLPDDRQGEEMFANIKESLRALKANDTTNYYGDMTIEVDSVKEEDWANNWKQYYKPFNIGERLLIKPTWEAVQDSDRLILEIDPASSFGTGQHHTTKLCLEALEGIIKGDNCGQRVLDLGCGSGILSIGALLLGAKHVTGVDIFENAVKTSQENIEQNGFSSDKYALYCGDIVQDEALLAKIGTDYDVITANIVADVIIGMSGILPKLLKDDGILLVSGIIEMRLDEVLSALKANGLTIKYTKSSEDWYLIACSHS